MTNIKEITLYVVGYDEGDAKAGLLFDGIESAEQYAQDEGGNVYSVTALVNFDTMALEQPDTEGETA